MPPPGGAIQREPRGQQATRMVTWGRHEKPSFLSSTMVNLPSSGITKTARVCAFAWLTSFNLSHADGYDVPYWAKGPEHASPRRDLAEELDKFGAIAAEFVDLIDE
jgi:hypothetical protein